MSKRIPASMSKNALDTMKEYFESETTKTPLNNIKKIQYDDCLLKVSECDMREAYEFLVQHPEIEELLPAQIIVVDSMPIWLDEKSQSQSCVFICEAKDEAKSGICLLLNGHVVETLRNILDENSTSEDIPAYVVPSIRDLVKIAADTRITAARLLSIYQFALSVADELCIPVPLILCTDMPTSNGNTDTFTDENKEITNSIVELSLCGLSAMKFYLVHEFRHIWQAHYTNYINEHIEYKVHDFHYLCDPYEVDANAYACVYFSSMGISDPLVFWAGSRKNLEAWQNDPDYLLIKKRIQELQTAASYLA